MSGLPLGPVTTSSGRLRACGMRTRCGSEGNDAITMFVTGLRYPIRGIVILYALNYSTALRHKNAMEAAGIEPASRSTSVRASTCVVGEFVSGQAADPPTGHPLLEPGFILPVCRQAADRFDPVPHKPAC